MSSSLPPLLKVEHLSISFGDHKSSVTVVDNLSYELHPNSILGIVGESGSGKSISSLAIMGLLPKGAKVESGKILFQNSNNEVDLLQLNNTQLQQYRGNKISMVFQEPMTSLNPLMLCGTQILEVMQTHQPEIATTAEVCRLMDEVELPNPIETYNKYPHQLSGGQKQRVMIAMALACRPQIIIADEPTTALDVSVQQEVVQLMKSLVNEERSFIFISHDLGLIADICDNIIVMKGGKTKEYGTRDQVILHPQNEYTKALLACRPSLNYDREFLPTLDHMQDRPPSDLHYHIDSDEAILSLKNIDVLFEIDKSNAIYFQALKDISFDIRKGEALGIVGESGSGKSTIANVIVGLQRNQRGEVYYKKERVEYTDRKKSNYFHKQIQLIFQDPYSSLNPRMRIGDAMMEVMLVNGTGGNTSTSRQQRVIELLESVGLHPNDFKKYPHEFSGGQRQRIVIARALAVEPDLIICDESVSALDVSVQAQVLNLLKTLQLKLGLSLLFISHDLSVVRFLCQRILVLQQGKIVEIQSADQLFAHPKSDYTQHLIDSIPGKSLQESR